MTVRNDYNQPVGPPMPEGWSPPPPPPREILEGISAQIEPLDATRHADDLWEASTRDHNGIGWTYMGYGPFRDARDLRQWVEHSSESDDPLYFAFIDKQTGKAIGWGAYMRINPAAAVIEVGSIWMSPLLQRSRSSTEIMHLLMKQAFDLGYRRYEWKCDSLNAPSRRAAERLGFSYEGLFRKATHYKGRSRDTAWYSIIDTEWPAIFDAQAKWLNAENFDDDGRQLRPLSDFVKQN